MKTYKKKYCVESILFSKHNWYNDYLKKILIKINVATDEGNSRNEI